MNAITPTDPSELLPITVDFNDPGAPAQFADSMHKTGFGVVKIRNGQLGIYKRELDRALKENQQLLDNLTLDIVRESLFMHDRYKDAGLFPFGAEGRTDGPPNLLEYVHHRPDCRDTPDNRASKRWISFPGRPFNWTWSVFKGMSRLNATLTGWLIDNMPATEEWAAVRANMERLRTQLDTDKRSVVRVLKYHESHPRFPDAKPDIDPEDQTPIWNDRHEDADWLTLIPAQTKPGLQLRNSSGRWYNIPWVGDPEDEYIYIVVNAGDTLSAASGGRFALCLSEKDETTGLINKLADPMTFEGWHNADEALHMWRDGDHYADRRLRLVKQGYYPSTTHRVKAGTGTRYSMPFFFHINGWVRVQGHWTARDKLRGYILNKEAQRTQAIARIESLYAPLPKPASARRRSRSRKPQP